MEIKKKKIRLLKFFLAAFFVVAAGCVYPQVETFLDLKKQERELQELIAQEESLKKELQNELDMSNSDLFIEKIAREQLGYIKPNEILFIDSGSAN